MSSKARTSDASAIAVAARVSPASLSSLLSSFVVVGLLALVLLPLIAGCGPPT
jgi:hypothetical protein